MMNAVPIFIRPFHPEDAPGVEFVVMSVLQEWGFLPSVKDRQEMDVMPSRNPFDAFYVAEHKEIGIVGCGGIIRLDDTLCELRKLYLLQRFRKQGVGHQMLNACVGEAARLRYKTMRFEVNATMAASVPFYERNGFILAPDEKPLSGEPDTLVYFKTLTESSF